MNHDLEQWTVEKRAVASEGGVVAAQHVTAARAGADMLARGGNAVDAAVAAAFALGAVEPWMCGLGGGGFAVVWRAETREAHVVDFQGVLPEAITREDYPLDPDVPDSIMGFPGVVDRANVIGAKSATVPGAAAGLGRLSTRFGKLGFDTVLEPAIALAERGLLVDWFTTLQIALAATDLSRNPAARAVYLPNGHPPQPETTLSLGALTESLRRLAADGPDAFYRGPLADALAADLAAQGSRMSSTDLAAYEALDIPVMSAEHCGARLLTAGASSGGQRLIDFFEHVGAHATKRDGMTPDGAAWTIYAEALNRAWRRHNIRIGRATEVGGCTSHLSAVDAAGNMVALTYTLLNRFGACVVSPNTGVLMNNAVSYFDPRPGFPTSMAGRKRINASNMCPTIAVRDDDALFAIGASGANHIVPATAQIAALMLDFEMTLEAAINSPRLHAADTGTVRADPRLGGEALEALGAAFELEIAQRLVFPKLYACPSGVSRDPATGRCWGLNDPSQPMGGAASPGRFDFGAVAAAPMALRP